MSDRLTRDAWVQHGLKVLAEAGLEGLNANSLAKSLGVSRGSFYWHFTNLDEFQKAVLTAWRERTTQAVISSLESLPQGARRLEALFRRVLTAREPLEAAIRRWSASNPVVAEALAEVDLLRLQYLKTELTAAGVAPEAVDARAAVLVWACAGRSCTFGPAAAISPDFSDELASLFAARC